MGKTLSNLDSYFSLPSLILFEFRGLETFPFIEIMDHLPPVRSLKLRYCSAQVIETLMSPDIFPQLEKLIIESCSSLTNEMLLHLVQSRTGSSHESLDRVPLQYLECRHNFGVTEEACLELKSYPRVEHVENPDKFWDPEY